MRFLIFFLIFFTMVFAKEDVFIKKNIEQGHPLQIVFIAYPRSASSYIRSVLMNFFSLPPVELIDEKEDTNIKISQYKANVYQYNDYLAWHHFPPKSQNVLILKKYQKKFFVHVRDPRQCLVSVVHFMGVDYIYDQSKEKLPENYLLLSFAEKVDFFIKNKSVQRNCRWIQGWLDVQKNEPELDIKITTFEALRENALAFFKDIVAFYGYDPEFFTERDLLPPSKSLHYRKGEIDEWKEVLTKEQIQEINAQIPNCLFERFGWPKE